MHDPPHEFVESGQKVICTRQHAGRLIRQHDRVYGLLRIAKLIVRRLIPKRSIGRNHDAFAYLDLCIFLKT